jgi:hypothetical protein
LILLSRSGYCAVEQIDDQGVQMARKVRSTRVATLAMAGVFLAASILFFSATAPKASASIFCANVQLAPFGSGGDRCWGPAMDAINWGEVRTTNRAGCVDIADASNNLLASWNCTAAGTSTTIFVSSPLGVYRKVVIRNNNTNNPGVFTGAQQCAWGTC